MAVNVNGGPLVFDAQINSGQFDQEINKIQRSIQGVSNTANQEAAAIDNLMKTTATAIGAYVSGVAIQRFVSDIVKVRGEFQQLEVAFTTMLGSKEEANKLMDQVTRFAATTPFELREVAATSKQLLAFGIEASKVEETLRTLGDVAAGLGQPIGEIAYLYGTIKTAGVANSVDIKQFAQRGIPIYEELAKVLKVNKDQVTALVSAGKVGFPEIEAAFKSLTAEGSKFGGLMEAQSKTLTGQLSNLSDAWDQMLNNLGKSGEGVFSTIISGASTAVENYQKVLDVIKVLVITYGSYKAAIIATAAVQAIATAATKGYTIAEMLRYRAMLLSETAMKLLNRTMLTNPFIAVTAGIAAIVAALVVFQKETTKAKSAQELLADAQEKFSSKLAETESKIRPYLNALKDANLTEQERLNIYNKLVEIDPKIVQGLNAKTLNYENLANNVNLYLGALRKQIALETNQAATVESIKNEQSIQAQIEKTRQTYLKLDATIKSIEQSGKGRQALPGLLSSRENAGSQLDALKKDLADQKKTTEEFGKSSVDTEVKTQEAKKRTIKVIEDEIKALKDKQAAESTTAAQKLAFDKDIQKLEKELAAIVGVSKKEQADITRGESERNKLLRERQSILQEIVDIQKSANQSGLIKEQSEIEKINQKYDKLLQNVYDYNELAKKAGATQIGTVEVEKIKSARTTELDNNAQKLDFDRYKEELERKKDLFEAYEEQKHEIGIGLATDLYKEQTKGYFSFIEFLEGELRQLSAKKILGANNVGDDFKFDFITKALEKAGKDSTEQLQSQQAQLIADTLSYEAQVSKIKDDAFEQEKVLMTLRTTLTENEYDQMLEVIRRTRDRDLQNLEDNLFKQTDLYESLTRDITYLSAGQIKKIITTLEEGLLQGGLSDGAKKAIEAHIKQLKELVFDLDKTNIKAVKTAGAFTEVGKGLSELGSSLIGVNEELGNTLNYLGSISGSIGASIKGFQDLKKASIKDANGNTDIAGQISAATSIASAALTVVNLVIGVLQKAKQSKIDSKAEVAEFYAQILRGETDLAIMQRERLLSQAALNKLTLDGLEAQKKQLELNKKASEDQAAALLKSLQAEQYVSGESTRRGAGSPLFGLVGIFTGLGGRTSVEKEMSDLAGKTYEQIEELFIKGQLTEKAADLFQQLQKLKQEGVDIDRQLLELKQRTQELFTGTTSDSITDSIIEGFKNGKRSASDFADTFEDMMRTAILQSLKLQYLEGPMKELFATFAEYSESGGSLTTAEIEELKRLYGSVIDNANSQLDQLETISGINLSSGSGGGGLSGAIKGITEQQADLLAGQFGGLRLTAIEHLRVAGSSLQVLNSIQVNTGLTSVRVGELLTKFDRYEKGLAKLKVEF